MKILLETASAMLFVLALAIAGPCVLTFFLVYWFFVVLVLAIPIALTAGVIYCVLRLCGVHL